MIPNKTKKQEDSELISLIENIENEKNKVEVISTISIIKEIKGNNKETLIKKTKEKPLFKQNNFDYFHFIQKILEEESFYLSTKFDYNNYNLNNEKPKNLNWDYNSLEILSKDKKPKEVNILDNQDIDYILKTTKFEQIKGNSQGDSLIPEGIDADKWEEFCWFKKLNPALMILKYALNPLS